MRAPRNLVGPVVRQLREQAGLTQPLLVARINLAGWEISRETLAKIEAQIRWVADFELVCLAKALEVPIPRLFASEAGDDRIPAGTKRARLARSRSR